ncbi:PREDICTED: synaptonemal complex central element protein 1-like [Chinchilla lanigera]|uniref:synaptonemal complex central element protein 1-like n=1 Tax=Chinchilla lanigera TaxID=34839 RepID=UPI000696BE25|nr:PREDICTED: synaptonemal complex central element protein 1-like [Chinchilla lanigera]
MAENVERLTEESSEAMEDGEGRARFLKNPEDLLAMVKKLQREGTLEPQIEDLIHRISELQQAKEKSSKELGETQALWEALNRELDSLNVEKVHLEEVLNKKQEALMILQQHCQARESEAPRLAAGEQLKDLVVRHKDLWEFSVLEQRLAREIRALERSREQLRAEGEPACGEGASPRRPHDRAPSAGRLLRARLRELEQRLRPAPEPGAAPAVSGGPKSELQSSEGPSRSAPEAGAGDAEGDLEPQAEPAPTPP